MIGDEIISGQGGDAPIINDTGAAVGGGMLDMGNTTFQAGAWYSNQNNATKDRVNKPGQSIVYGLKRQVIFKQSIKYDENENIDYRERGFTFPELDHIFSTQLHYAFEKEAIDRFSALITSNYDNQIQESLKQALTYGFCVVSDEGTAGNPSLRLLKNAFPFFNPLDEVEYYSLVGLKIAEHFDDCVNVIVTSDGTFGVDKDNKLLEDLTAADVGLEEFPTFERLHVIYTNNFEPIWADAYSSILRYDLNLEQADGSINRYQNAILQIRNLIRGMNATKKQTESELRQFYDNVHVVAYEMNRQAEGNYPTSPELSYVQPNIDVNATMQFLEEIKSNIYRMLGIVRSEDLAGNQALDTVVIRTQEMLNRATEYSKQLKESYTTITGLSDIGFEIRSQVPIYGIIKELNGVTNISQEMMTDLIMTGYSKKEKQAELDRVLLTQRDELGMAGALRGVINGN
ncbi:hypothetical protein [Lactococcus allomyrinae]|uniref:Uncharacterized protein n=1 Tax=Lactococcus allomyrinae TaxID=2419773 RepID=A0A387BGE8_9LACT|nr:hypothetical protein [Lactococcus allomyrinae]AYG01698.1 hypothetical protein D7I46_11925 [Lactococcus allomyrinae]